MTFSLHHGDCLAPEGLASLPDRSIDVVITDPPYSAHVHDHHRRGTSHRNDSGAPYVIGSGETKRRISESKELGFGSITQAEIESAADHLARLVRRWAVVFCDVESSHLWKGALTSAGLDYVRTMAWVKLGGTPQFTGDRPAVGFEAIVLAHQPGRKRWNGGGKAGIYSVPTAIDRDRRGWDARMHTTQKPLLLMEHLVVDFTDAGETILDPFAGSGTTGLAALRLGRRFVGWERDEANHAAAAERLRDVRELPAGFHGEARQGALL